MMGGKYKVVFEFRSGLGKWVTDQLTNDGAGFTRDEAQYIMHDIATNDYLPVRDVRIERMD